MLPGARVALSRMCGPCILEGSPSSSGLEGGQVTAGTLTSRAAPGPYYGAHRLEEQVRFVSL